MFAVFELARPERADLNGDGDQDDHVFTSGRRTGRIELQELDEVRVADEPVCAAVRHSISCQAFSRSVRALPCSSRESASEIVHHRVSRPSGDGASLVRLIR